MKVSAHFPAWYSILIGSFVFGIVGANIECDACESATNNTCTEFWDPEFEIAKASLSDCHTG